MSCEACGWATALISIIAFGSFGVPIKSDAAKSVDIDPLVFQSYKTTMCFLTSWLVLLFGQDFTFSPWGIVSGLFWVPGGVATVYAVKTAGLAVGIGVGSSFIVLVSFTWGIFGFHESVESIPHACFAVFLMIMGISGMAYYSSPQKAIPMQSDNVGGDVVSSSVAGSSGSQGYLGIIEQTEEQDNPEDDFADDQDASEEESDNGSEGVISRATHDHPHADGSSQVVIVMCRKKISKRTLGVCAAAFCGIWGGSIMVPMHFAPKNDLGMGYTISFAIGASLVNLLVWLLRYLYRVYKTRSFTEGYYSLPSFHLQTMWCAGGTSGTLWSIANFFSLLSVEYLGEGVGYSVTQASLLVAGLWGIFYYREIVGAGTISKWFASAFLTVSGIILLSYEHHEGIGPHAHPTHHGEG